MEKSISNSRAQLAWYGNHKSCYHPWHPKRKGKRCKPAGARPLRRVTPKDVWPWGEAGSHSQPTAQQGWSWGNGYEMSPSCLPTAAGLHWLMPIRRAGNSASTVVFRVQPHVAQSWVKGMGRRPESLHPHNLYLYLSLCDSFPHSPPKNDALFNSSIYVSDLLIFSKCWATFSLISSYAVKM